MKRKVMWLETHVKPAFQLGTPWKLPETFLVFWEDSGSEDLVSDQGIGNAYVYYRQKMHYYCHALLLPVFSKITDISSRKSQVCGN